MRVIVTGLIGTYPLGGVAWDYLQFVKGFVALGCDVTYLEDTKQWAYDPVGQTFTEDCRANVAHLERVMGRVPGMERSFAFRDPSGALAHAIVITGVIARNDCMSGVEVDRACDGRRHGHFSARRRSPSTTRDEDRQENERNRRMESHRRSLAKEFDCERRSC